jgi:predicted Ser/Thr protein kinase
MECLREQTIFLFVRGQLAEPMASHVGDHLGECADCRGLVAATVRSLRTAETSASEVASEVERGTALAAGRRVGRYVISHVIGSGGQGVVYAAHDPVLNRKIILKLIHDDEPKEGSEAIDSHAWLLREAQAMAQLAHPNVVSVYDFGTFEDQVFLAMEYVEGRTLRAWLAESARDPGEVLALFAEAGRGLAAAHQVGIVHRDFKPENLLVGTDGRVRVTDFGLARPIEPPECALDPASPEVATTSEFGTWDLAMTLTRTGAVKGTPAYMAPEQFLSRAAEPRTDQFSFSVALYEALYGRRPFQGGTIEELGRAVLAGRVRPRPEGSSVAGAVHAAVLRGLSVAPAERFPSLMELLAALEPAATAVRPRRRRALAAFALVGLVFAAGVAARQRQAPVPAAAVMSAPAEPKAASASAPPEPAALPVAPAPAAPPEPAALPVAPAPATPLPRTRSHLARPRAKKPGHAGIAPHAPAKAPDDDSFLAPSFLRKR